MSRQLALAAVLSAAWPAAAQRTGGAYPDGDLIGELPEDVELVVRRRIVVMAVKGTSVILQEGREPAYAGDDFHEGKPTCELRTTADLSREHDIVIADEAEPAALTLRRLAELPGGASRMTLPDGTSKSVTRPAQVVFRIISAPPRLRPGLLTGLHCFAGDVEARQLTAGDVKRAFSGQADLRPVEVKAGTWKGESSLGSAIRKSSGMKRLMQGFLCADW